MGTGSTAWRRKAHQRPLVLALVAAVGVHVLAGVLTDRYLSRLPDWTPATELGDATVSLSLIPQFTAAPDPVPEPEAVPEALPERPVNPEVALPAVPEPAPVAPPPVPRADPLVPATAADVPVPPPERPIETPIALSPPPAPPTPPTLLGGAARIQPRYPFVSRLKGEEGTVTVRAWISAAGRVVEAETEASSGFPSLDEAALSAVRAARFAMSPDAGERTEISIPIRFELTD